MSKAAIRVGARRHPGAARDHSIQAPDGFLMKRNNKIFVFSRRAAPTVFGGMSGALRAGA